jgi:hypothetical protein
VDSLSLTVFVAKKRTMKKLKILILFIFFSLSFLLNAQEMKKWELNGYLKYMQTVSIFKPDSMNTTLPWITDNLIHNRLNFKYFINDQFTFAAEMRNRVIYGEQLNLDFTGQYANMFEQEEGFIDLSSLWIKEKSVLVHSVIDRLYLDYTKGKWQVTVGRQRINWAQTMAFNPNDIFNAYSYFDFDYEERPGSDAVRIQFYPNYTSKFEVAIKINEDEELTAAALYRFNKWNTDIQFLGGYFDSEDFVVGAGWSGSLFKGGFRGELSYFHPEENMNDTSGVFVATVGYDYTFKNSLILTFEGLYNENGLDNSNININQLMLMQQSAKNIFIAKTAVLGSISYPITPLLNASFATIYSPGIEMFYLGPTLNYSIKENLQLMLTSQYYHLKEINGASVFWRLKLSF